MKLKLWLTAVPFLWMFALPLANAQQTPAERNFPQSKPVVEAALRRLRSATAGHLPVLDGFAVPGEQPLDRFQKGYYQCTVEVTPGSGGGSLVRVSAKITAWYDSSVTSQSGYRVLPSNGRLESDLLDRLTETLATKSPSTAASALQKNSGRVNGRDTGHSGLAGVNSNLPSAPSFNGNAFPRTDMATSAPPRGDASDRHSADLDKEAKNLEEILRNQAHPNNLVAVRKSGTPILISPSEGAKVLFVADAEDEFEILDSNESWVHVRISGLSRGWIRLSSVEMPDSQDAADPQVEAAPVAPTATAVGDNKAPFQIENEQTASFPGDWEPLRGKVVRIVSLQKTAGSADSSPQAKLAFVRGLLDKEYKDIAATSSTAAGVVLIFDSADGGMVAATLEVLREWKAGTLSEEALWRRCYFDPPEMFHGAGQ